MLLSLGGAAAERNKGSLHYAFTNSRTILIAPATRSTAR